MRRGYLAVLVLTLANVGCAKAAPVRLISIERNGAPALAVVARAGDRINARVEPAIEWGDGRVSRLTQGRRDAAGDYFVEVPWVARPLDAPPKAVLRVGYCRADESLCRSVALPVDLPTVASLTTSRISHVVNRR